MSNRAQRRKKKPGNKGAEHNMVKMMAKAKWAANAAHKIESARRAQRMLWICVISINDAFGIGAGRIGKFIDSVVENSKKWDEMASGADVEYADDKLRQAAEKVCGTPIPYLYEDEYVTIQPAEQSNDMP